MTSRDFGPVVRKRERGIEHTTQREKSSDKVDPVFEIIGEFRETTLGFVRTSVMNCRARITKPSLNTPRELSGQVDMRWHSFDVLIALNQAHFLSPFLRRCECHTPERVCCTPYCMFFLDIPPGAAQGHWVCDTFCDSPAPKPAQICMSQGEWPCSAQCLVSARMKCLTRATWAKTNPRIGIPRCSFVLGLLHFDSQVDFASQTSHFLWRGYHRNCNAWDVLVILGLYLQVMLPPRSLHRADD